MVKLIPNFLTLLRLFLALLFPFIEGRYYVGVVVAALLTEFFDGFLARKFKVTSHFGEIMDPIADKVFFVSVILTLAPQKNLDIWQLVQISIRELAVLVGTVFLLIVGLKNSKSFQYIGKMRPNIWGKITTFFHYLIFFNILFSAEISKILLAVTLTVGILASIQYYRLFINERPWATP